MLLQPMSSPMMKTMLGLGAGPPGGACAAAGGIAKAPQSIVPLQASVASLLRFMVVSSDISMPALRGRDSARNCYFAEAADGANRLSRTDYDMLFVEDCLTEQDSCLTAWDERPLYSCRE